MKGKKTPGKEGDADASELAVEEREHD